MVYIWSFDGNFMQERSLIMLRFADLVDKHREELAALESWNSGKPYEQSLKSEVPTFARLFRYYAGEIFLKDAMLLCQLLLWLYIAISNAFLLTLSRLGR